jgi:hypothetical protein
MFTSFDAPSREVACSRRPRTNTPLQALATLNDRSFVEMSNALARRVLTESGSTAEERLTFAFRCCVARPPCERERQVLLELLERNRRSYAFRSEAAKKLAGTGVKGIPAFEVAAWTIVANVLLNLDETVTKE